MRTIAFALMFIALPAVAESACNSRTVTSGVHDDPSKAAVAMEESGFVGINRNELLACMTALREDTVRVVTDKIQKKASEAVSVETLCASMRVIPLHRSPEWAVCPAGTRPFEIARRTTTEVTCGSIPPKHNPVDPRYECR